MKTIIKFYCLLHLFAAANLFAMEEMEIREDKYEEQASCFSFWPIPAWGRLEEEDQEERKKEL